MEKTVINSERAPAAIGPYSQAIAVGRTLYISGQIPLEPGSGAIVGEGLREQTVKVLENLKAVVEASGAGMSSICKVTIYLTDMSTFSVVNEIYGSFFSSPFPARACVEVSGLPKGVQVEMDAVAYIEN